MFNSILNLKKIERYFRSIFLGYYVPDIVTQKLNQFGGVTLKINEWEIYNL